MRRRTIAVATAVALAAALAACGSSSNDSSTSTGAASTAGKTGSGQPVKLGLIMKFPVDFYLAMKSAAQKWDAANSGATVTIGIGHSATDDQGEINLIQSMVTQGVKGIAITPTSPAVIPALDAAVAKGVKVVLIDNDLPDWSKKSSVVATDNLKGGQLAGQFLAKQLKQGATIAVLQGVPGVPALDDRVKGMEQGLGSSGIKIVGKAPTDCDQNKGVSAAADLLSAHPDVDAIYGACGPPMLGAIQAAKKAKRGSDLTLVGFDALPDEVKQIQAGTETASVAQFPAKMGELGMATLLKAVQGQSVPPNVDTGTAVVTKDNAGQFGG
jgi:ABC-type sugar transport system substrate-binding protein